MIWMPAFAGMTDLAIFSGYVTAPFAGMTKVGLAYTGMPDTIEAICQILLIYIKLVLGDI